MGHVFVVAMAVAVGTVACGGSNPYGFARDYQPDSKEEPYYERAENVVYEEVRRDPELLRGKLLGWFGVVTAVEQKPGPNTRARVALDLRFHQQRHLCENQSQDSCRVTVSERSGGPFSALIVLRPEDSEGTNRVNAGSLLKIYGIPTGDYDEQGGPVIETRFYRHWPSGTYVTTAWRDSMRR